MPEIDTEALGGSVQNSMQNIAQGGWNSILQTAIIALVILIVCLIIKKILLGVVDRGLDKSRVELSFHKFIRSVVNVVLWFVTLMVVCEYLGIKATSLLALLSLAGLAVSLSVQGSLANLAGGLTILVSKPFKVGDYVEVGATAGTVKEIGMVYTKLTTLDHRQISIPNSAVVGAEVTNYATEPLRRVDLTVPVSYACPAEQVKKCVMDVMNAHEKVLQDPEPFVRVSAYNDCTVEYTIRAWCNNADYWDVYFDLLEQVKVAFDKEGICIPLPQMEVRVHP